MTAAPYNHLLAIVWACCLPHIVATPADGFISNTEKPPLSSGLHKVGYTPQPNNRGTLDILWSCAITIFLCTWSINCCHVPAFRDGTRVHVLRKTLLCLLCTFGPELMFASPFSQLRSAQNACNAYRESGFSDWTLKHAFLVDAGFYHLQTPDFPPIPINAKQLLYLVKKGYIALPKLTKEDIEDRNKADTFLRLLTLFQVIWFTIDLFLRYLQGLHVTTLELSVMAFIFCSICIAICWWNKPMDVRRPCIIPCSTLMAQIVVDAGASYTTYRYTPLDFIFLEEWADSRVWTQWTSILRHLPFKSDRDTRPIRRIDNLTTIPIEGWSFLVWCIISAAYLGIFILAWNHDFPTAKELLAWRIVSVTSLSLMVPIWFTEQLGFKWWSVWRANLERYSLYNRYRQRLTRTPDQQYLIRVKTRVCHIADRCRNNSLARDPEMNVPLKAQLPLTFLGGLYILGRLAIATLDLMELRLLPESAYQTAQFPSLFPHA